MNYMRVNWKYRLNETYHHRFRCEHLMSRLLGRLDKKSIVLGYFTVYGSTIAIGPGYAWDGASGPTLDTKDTMRGSLVHDALYQCLKMALKGGFSVSRERRLADKEFRIILKEDGMSFLRRWLWWAAVRIFGRASMNASRGQNR